MAPRRSPRKPARVTSPRPAKDHKPSRGTRGYHKFRGGLLNVKPQKGEKEIVKRNAEQSPLLRLPAEIRDMIWKLALGGNVIRPVRSKSHVRGFFHPFPQVDTNGPHPPAYRFSLLQVCRQIYSEAASLPCHLSTFCFYDDLDLELWQRQAPASKTKLVRSVRYGSWESTLESVLETQRHIQGMEKLQNVQHYDVQFFSYQTHFQSQHDLATFERLKLEVEADNKVQFTYECHSSLQVWQSIFSQGI